jgi:hypothetical protein
MRHRKRSLVRLDVSRALTLGLAGLAAFLTWDRLRKAKRFARDERELDSDRRQPMTHNIAVNVGDHVFFEDGAEEIGAVRKVERDHLVVYIEGAGDFVIRGPEIKAVHYSKVVLAPELVDPRLLAAARQAHEDETD